MTSRSLAAALMAALALAAAGLGFSARGDEALAALCQKGVASAEPCRGALERAAAADVLALVEQWVAAQRYASAQQALEQLQQRQPWNTRVTQRLHEVASLAEEAQWLARRQTGAASAVAAAASPATPSAAAASLTPSAPSGDTGVTLVETRCTRLSGEAALAACDQLLAVRPGDARILAARGDLLLTLNRAPEALAAYRAAAASAPSPALDQKITLAEAIVRPLPLAGPTVAASAGATAAPPLDPATLGRFHALLIGNNAYRHLDRLETAVNDARAVGDVLRAQYGFDVRLLTDATRADIVETLDEYRSRLEPADNLLIYYAGHGWLDPEADKGFWLPVDAQPEKRTQWVSNDTVRDALRALKAKHVLVVADSCFAGALTRGASVRAGRSADYLARMARLKARQVLSSGGLEPVADSGGDGHSPFAAALIQALQANTGVLDATTLFAELRRPVALRSNQVPQFADIRMAGHEGGDFLFMRRK